MSKKFGIIQSTRELEWLMKFVTGMALEEFRAMFLFTPTTYLNHQLSCQLKSRLILTTIFMF